MNYTKDDFINDEKTFGLRLARHRECKNISAREMSLALGQNKNYINAIEAGRNYPSMTAFLYICDYIGISPKDFFDPDYQNPVPPKNLENILRQLTPSQAKHVYQIALDIVSKD